MTTQPSIGQQIREMREQRGLSIAQLARQAGISQAALGSYERGDRRAPIHQLDKVLAVLDAQLAVVPRGMDIENLLTELWRLREFEAQITSRLDQQQAA